MNALLRRWRTMATVGAAVFGIITPFLLAPVTVWKNVPPTDTKAFAAFGVTVLCALFLYLAHALRFRTNQRRCAKVVAVLLILTAGSFLSYQSLRDAWAVKYYDKHIVIGAELIPEFRDRFRAVRDPVVIVNEADKSSLEFWDRSEVLRRRLVLHSLYFLVTALGTATVIFPTRLEQR